MEQANLLNEFSEPTFVPASPGQRIANYLIDVIVYYVFVFIIGLISGLSGAMTGDTEGEPSTLFLFLMIGFFFVYYTVLEGSKGKTVGKMITKTKVVTESGEPISFGQAFLRTLCRFVPFEFISVFTGSQMWHDKWVKTAVVKDI